MKPLGLYRGEDWDGVSSFNIFYKEEMFFERLDAWVGLKPCLERGPNTSEASEEYMRDKYMLVPLEFLADYNTDEDQP